jgi:hypothetical protein
MAEYTISFIYFVGRSPKLLFDLPDALNALCWVSGAKVNQANAPVSRAVKQTACRTSNLGISLDLTQIMSYRALARTECSTSQKPYVSDIHEDRFLNMGIDSETIYFRIHSLPGRKENTKKKRNSIWKYNTGLKPCHRSITPT